MRRNESSRAQQGDGPESGVEPGFRSRSTGEWTAIPCLDGRGCVLPGKLAIEVGQSLKGDDVVRALSRIGWQRALPKVLFCDNGSEFTSRAMELWAYQAGCEDRFLALWEPTDNAHVESFNATLRAECLDAHWLASLAEARQIIEGWRREYNESCPHRAQGRGRQTKSPNPLETHASWTMGSCCGRSKWKWTKELGGLKLDQAKRTKGVETGTQS